METVNKYFSFVQELHSNLVTLLSYKDNTVKHKQRTLLYNKDYAHCNLETMTFLSRTRTNNAPLSSKTTTL